MGLMSRGRRLLWFSVLYVASIVTFAFVALSIRGLLQLAQRLVF
jgi:hypothetical protein